MKSGIFEQQVLFRVDFIYGFRTNGSVPQGGARGQNLEHLILFFFCFNFSFMDSFVFRQHVLFRVDFLSVTLDHSVEFPRVGLRVKIYDISIFFIILFFSYVIICI